MLMKFMKMMQRKNNSKGFTLVELMVVVVIIGILVAIAVPVYNSTQDTARRNANAANIRILEGAIQAYLVDHTGTYANLTMAADGTIGGNGVTAGSLVPDYIQAMPTPPTGYTAYIKSAGATEKVKNQ